MVTDLFFWLDLLCAAHHLTSVTILQRQICNYMLFARQDLCVASSTLSMNNYSIKCHINGSPSGALNTPLILMSCLLRDTFHVDGGLKALDRQQQSVTT